MTTTTILALRGALASSVAITIDVLAMANHVCRRLGRPPAFDVRLAGSGADQFRPFLAFPEARHERGALLVIPAQGFSKADSYPARLGEDDALEARDMVLASAAAGASVATSCTGTLLLAATRLLDHRSATTAWWLAPAFQALFPAVRLDTAALVLRDGPFTTAGAAMAQMDLMIGLVSQYAGAEVADQCARTMLIDERPSQTPYISIGMLAAANDSVARAAAWAKPRLGQGIGVNDLAEAVGQSPRTFSRRVTEASGLSPVQFLQQLRVEQALDLIRNTPLSFDEIAYRVGYSDPSTLRELVRRRSGYGPRELRARARRSDSPPDIAAR